VILHHNKNGNYVIYDKDGRVVIITCRKDHAIGYAKTLMKKSNGN
jgi:regulatory protein YycI of two-component signal transduction system YycFG